MTPANTYDQFAKESLSPITINWQLIYTIGQAIQTYILNTKYNCLSKVQQIMDTSPTGHFVYWTFRLLCGHF